MPRKTAAYHTGKIGKPAKAYDDINHDSFAVAIRNAACAALMGVQLQYRKRLLRRHRRGDVSATELLRTEYHLLV